MKENMKCKECNSEDWETITPMSIQKDPITLLPLFLFQCKQCKRVVMTDIQSTYDKELKI